MDQELKNKLDEQGVKIDAIYKSVEKTRKYFLTIIWITVLAVVIPLIGLAFAIPSFLSNYSDLSGLGI
jgi:F0F1-type ATP synthase membrane subunit c/vacuolar-type H+-ATPase subunit K